MVTALDSLIKLMQFSSKNSREVIRIQDEIDLIRDYINLINLKYFDRIFVDVHVEPGLENCETLKFLLQPIVENSIYTVSAVWSGNARCRSTLPEKNEPYSV